MKLTKKQIELLEALASDCVVTGEYSGRVKFGKVVNVTRGGSWGGMTKHAMFNAGLISNEPDGWLTWRFHITDRGREALAKAKGETA
jgi:hypothetical protein